VVEVKVGVYAARAVAVLFTSCHDRVSGVPYVGGCTAIPGATKLVHHIGSIMTIFGGSGREL